MQLTHPSSSSCAAASPVRARGARRRRALAAGAVLSFALPVLPGLGSSPAAADPLLDAARAWLVAQQEADGGFEMNDFPGFETADATLALASLAQTEGQPWDAAAAHAAVAGEQTGGRSALDYLDDLVEDPTLSPAQAAKYVALVVGPLGLDAADVDPSDDSAEPVDVWARIETAAVGDGTYSFPGQVNGLFTVALAHWATGRTVPPALVAQIRAAQQAGGGYDYAGDPAGTVVDLDSTSMAVIALSRAGVPGDDPTVAAAVGVLRGLQEPSGSWASFGESDPNTTAMATMAFAAAGAVPDVDPMPWLRDQQGDDGHIVSPNDAWGVNTFATSQTLQVLTPVRWLAPIGQLPQEPPTPTEPTVPVEPTVPTEPTAPTTPVDPLPPAAGPVPGVVVTGSGVRPATGALAVSGSPRYTG